MIEKLDIAIEDYSNLKKLLRGEEEEDILTSIFQGHSKTTKAKGYSSNKRDQNEGKSVGRPISTSTQSNFVFKKKKINPRSETELAFLNTSSKGFMSNENLVRLNGIVSFGLWI